jgi:hypothetical protein
VKISKHQKLCKVCDQILASNTANPQIIANNYLHILNSHPEFLEKYNLSKVAKIQLLVKFRFIAIVKLFQSVFDKKYYYTSRARVKSDVLFVSHLINEQQLSNDNDVYFGDLPNQLIDSNVNSSIALINHAKISSKRVLNSWKSSKIYRPVLSSSLDILSEVKLYLFQRKSKKQLKVLLKDLQVDKTLVKDVLQHHMSSGTFNALRIAKQVADIVKKTGAKYIVTTFEGYAWERLVYYYAREVNPNIKCFGYQHAAVFENQHAIKRSLAELYNPDVILTSGLIAKDIFEKMQFKDGEIICLGSPKYSAPNLIISKSQHCCLVVPELFVRESLSLFGLSLACAKQNPEQRFIWRLHPGLSFDKLKKQSTIFKNLPINITLSNDSLDDDIQKCDSVLYRGSTSVVNAINSGLKPIYYQQSVDELSIDPIYTHQEGKFTVHNQEELGLTLVRNVNIETKQALQNFSQNFYTPLDVRILLKEFKH